MKRPNGCSAPSPLPTAIPTARILISSGSGSAVRNGPAEAPIIAAYFKEIGIDPARITIEDRSRTTSENAVFSRALADPKPGERWLLVTSAWHMPRSIGRLPQGRFPGRRLPGRLPHRRRPMAAGDFSPSSRKACGASTSGRRNGWAWSPIISPGTRARFFPSPLGLRQRQPVDALEIVRIDGAAPAQDRDAAFLHEPDGGWRTGCISGPQPSGLSPPSARATSVGSTVTAGAARRHERQHLGLDLFSRRVSCHRSPSPPRARPTMNWRRHIT